MAYFPNIADSFSRGLQAGMQLGDSIVEGKQRQEMIEMKKQQMAIDNALLQANNPGLTISEKTAAAADRPEALKAGAVIPGTEGDQVKALGGGVLYNTTERDRVDDAIAARDRKRKLALIEAEHEIAKKYRKGTYDASTGMEIVETDQGLQYRPITPVGSQGDPLKGSFDRETERRANESEKDFERRKLLEQAERDFQIIERQKDRDATKSLADIKRDKTPVKMSASDQQLVDTLSTANAKKISIANQIEQGLKTLQDPNVDEKTKVAIGKQMGKTLNSTEGADAVGVEESKRLLGLLEYNFFNPKAAIAGEGAFIGRDLKGFTSQVNETMKNVRGAVSANEKIISDVESKYGVGSGPRGSGEKSETINSLRNKYLK